MNSYISYEIKAEAFRIMTGHTAPGKDAASASYPASFEERHAAFDKWMQENGECIKAMLKAADNFIGE
jgi:hypothetical protein